MLRSNSYDYSDAYFIVTGTVALAGGNNDRKSRGIVFKNNAPITSCISKINNVIIDNVDNLDVATPMCNLLEYSKNYRKTTGSFWNYYRDELTDDADDATSPNIKVINSKIFKYKSGIIGNKWIKNQ